jgi:hypothetical protein
MWYLTLRVIEEFRDQYGKYPGMSDIEDQNEFAILFKKLSELV